MNARNANTDYLKSQPKVRANNNEPCDGKWIRNTERKVAFRFAAENLFCEAKSCGKFAI